MKNPITNAQLKFNCPVDWDSMEDTAGGKNCHQCQKKVFDLTNCSQDEMDVILAQNNYKICAKFSSQQLAPQPINFPFWKKWATAAVVLLGFNLFNGKAVAQNTSSIVEQKGSSSNNKPIIMGEVAINVPTIHARPVIGVEKFNNSILKLIPFKKVNLLVIVSVDKLGNLTEVGILPDTETAKKLDSLTKNKIEDIFRNNKWNPGTIRGKNINDVEFPYQIYTPD
jgi:hypothetical protein